MGSSTPATTPTPSKWGPINRISWRRTGRVDEITGEDRLARINPPQGGFRSDPHSPAVYALEDFDATTGTARKAPIMRGRVVAPRTPRLGADTPADAIAICLDTHGEVRLDDVARLLGRSEADTRQALTGLVFVEPPSAAALTEVERDALAVAGMTPADQIYPTDLGDGGRERLIPAPEYLSGNVRVKLTVAEAAAERDAATLNSDGTTGGRRWDANIAALREMHARPTWRRPRSTPAWARPGSTATPCNSSCARSLDEPGCPGRAPRRVHLGGARRAAQRAGHQHLRHRTHVDRRDRGRRCSNSAPSGSSTCSPNGSRIPNLTETIAAQEKAGEVTERFSDWVWD